MWSLSTIGRQPGHFFAATSRAGTQEPGRIDHAKSSADDRRFDGDASRFLGPSRLFKRFNF
jgi:hypothetical protein